MTGTHTDYDAWAWLYDRTLGPDYSGRKMAFLNRVLLDRLPAGARVLDLCCGTGQMMVPMIARGLEVTGLDLSGDMLRYAARNAPAAKLVQGDARDFHLDGTFAGAVCASASLNHMRGLDELRQVFRAVHRALDEGGIFVFDVNHPAQMTRHWLGRATAGEIAGDHAWLITPRYEPAAASGAFRVDMYRKQSTGCSSAGYPLWLALLRRPLLRRLRLRHLAGFAQRHPDWDHRRVDYPVFGHDLQAVLQLLAASGFEAQVETFSGGGVNADSAACFVCRKARAESRMEAAE